MSTAHISASLGDFAKTVIMPGDPKRATYIANNFLTNAKLVSDIRGIPAYTGLYNGKKVSVMASGMGNPSMGIYSYELFNFYDVENIIRVGTCGVYDAEFEVGDVAVANASVSVSNYANLFKGEPYTLFASKKLQKLAQETAIKTNTKLHFGTTYCSDNFYADKTQQKIMKKFNCFGVEMETTALFANAKQAKKHAIAVLTVSDNITTGKEMTPKERELSLNKMITFALEMALWEYFYWFLIVLV